MPVRASRVIRSSRAEITRRLQPHPRLLLNHLCEDIQIPPHGEDVDKHGTEQSNAHGFAVLRSEYEHNEIEWLTQKFIVRTRN